MPERTLPGWEQDAIAGRPKRGSEPERHIPFDCGSQRMDWDARNCDRCTKGYCSRLGPDAAVAWVDDTDACPIERAISEGAMSDAKVSDEIAKRMGLLDNEPPRQDGFSYTWDCPERELIAECGEEKKGEL